MAKIAQKINGNMMRTIRRIALPYGGQKELAKLTGVTQPTIRSILASGKARPDIIERLAVGLEKRKQ